MIHTGAILAKGRGAFELDKKNFLIAKNIRYFVLSNQLDAQKHLTFVPLGLP